MGTFLIILALFFFLLPLLRRWLAPWIQRYMARKAEDMIRRQMGMPPREKKSRRQQKAQASSGQNRSSARKPKGEPDDGPIIPPEYAEDVEFVEIKEFDNVEVAAETVSDDGKKRTRREYTETQVSDAEWVDIK